MQIDITGHHVDISDPIREYVNTKFNKLERHFDNVVDVHVVLTVEKLQRKAEATFKVSGATLFADAVNEDMYAAIDALIDKLDRQVLKHKEKRADHRRAEGSMGAALREDVED